MEAQKNEVCFSGTRPTWCNDLAFVVPNYDWWEAPFYGLGLKLYQLLAGKYGFAPHAFFPEKRRSNTFPPSRLRACAARSLLR